MASSCAGSKARRHLTSPSGSARRHARQDRAPASLRGLGADGKARRTPRTAIDRAKSSTPRPAGSGRKFEGYGRAERRSANSCSCGWQPIASAKEAAPPAATRLALDDKMRGFLPVTLGGSDIGSADCPNLHVGSPTVVTGLNRTSA